MMPSGRLTRAWTSNAMAKFDVTVSHKEVDATPEEQRVIYQSILDILRKNRAYLLTPAQIPLKMEMLNPSEKGEGNHD
jgi:hypothetical protein